MENNLIFDGTIIHETGYFQISNNIFDLKFKVKEVKKDKENFRDLNTYEINIYCYLCRCANNKNNAFPSYNTIADKVRCSRRKAIDSIKVLSENGFLYKEIRYISNAKDNKKNKSNIYIINNNLDKLQKTLETIYKNDNNSAQYAPPSAQCAPSASAQYAPPSAQCAPYKEQLKKNNIKKEQLNNNREKVVVVEEDIKKAKEIIKNKLGIDLSIKEINTIVYGINEKYGAFKEEVLLNALEVVLNFADPIQNIGGFIYKAIREDYKINPYKDTSSSKEPKFVSNCPSRNYDYDSLERQLLGWIELPRPQGYEDSFSVV